VIPNNWKYWVFAAFLAAFSQASAIRADGLDRAIVLAATTTPDSPGASVNPDTPTQTEPEPTPEQKYQARFPQPTMVGHLVGLPVLDGDDSTIGYVKEVVKDPDGKIKLIVPYAKWRGWARDGSFLAHSRRPVAVPLEAVALLARQIDALDMDRDAFDKAPTWSAGTSQAIPSSQIIKIAIQRR
jgi:hypothetical protein